MLFVILTGVLFVLVGAFLFWKTETFWKITERWKSYSADSPSDFYLKSTKLGGLAFALFGLVLIVLSFVAV